MLNFVVLTLYRQLLMSFFNIVKRQYCLHSKQFFSSFGLVFAKGSQSKWYGIARKIIKVYTEHKVLTIIYCIIRSTVYCCARVLTHDGRIILTTNMTKPLYFNLFILIVYFHVKFCCYRTFYKVN